jgi:hypothetical protein
MTDQSFRLNIDGSIYEALVLTQLGRVSFCDFGGARGEILVEPFGEQGSRDISQYLTCEKGWQQSEDKNFRIIGVADQLGDYVVEALVAVGADEESDWNPAERYSPKPGGIRDMTLREIELLQRELLRLENS